MFDDLTEAGQELDALAGELNGRMGQYAPSFTGLRQAVGECRSLAQQILQRKGPDVSSEGEAVGDEAAGEAGPAAGGGSFVGRQVASRVQVYQQLAQAAAMLQQLEPHSPIPYLIKRAVELGGLPFPELMRALISDSEVLAGMNRELGIKDARGMSGLAGSRDAPDGSMDATAGAPSPPRCPWRRGPRRKVRERRQILRSQTRGRGVMESAGH